MIAFENKIYKLSIILKIILVKKKYITTYN